MRNFANDERGAAALEYAFVLPALIGFAIAVMDLGRLVWTEVTLDRAVQVAARCASVNSTNCGTNAAIQSYAATSAWGLHTPASSFIVTRLTCGVSVRVQASFRYYVPWPKAPTPVTSQACYPLS